MRPSIKLCLSLGLVQFISVGIVSSASAQITTSERSSSSSTTTESETKGYAFKYKERLGNYAQQIDKGVSNGWLSASEAANFRSRLEQLRSQDAAAGQAGYPKDQLDNLDKSFTKFNEDLSSASSKSSAGTGSATSTKVSSENSQCAGKSSCSTKKKHSGHKKKHAA